jgi:hypothetical protein
MNELPCLPCESGAHTYRPSLTRLWKRMMCECGQVEYRARTHSDGTHEVVFIRRDD